MQHSKSRSLQVTAAFAIVYLVWGSNYVAVAIGVNAAPPLLFSGVRFLIAAPLLLAYARLRGDRMPAAFPDWTRILGSGALILVVASGLAVWAQQWVASGQTALIVASSALWMAWFGSWGAQGEPMSWSTALGLLVGLAGVGLLVGTGLRADSKLPAAYAALGVSAVAVAAGSVLMRHRVAGCGWAMTAGLQAALAGVVLCAGGLLHGDAAHWVWTPRSAGALVYLAVFGSCLGYGAFCWLVHAVAPAQLGTFAFVNPAVAVLLGWLILDERLGAVQLAGTTVILGSVAMLKRAGAGMSAGRTRREPGLPLRAKESMSPSHDRLAQGSSPTPDQLDSISGA